MTHACGAGSSPEGLCSAFRLAHSLSAFSWKTNSTGVVRTAGPCPSCAVGSFGPCARSSPKSTPQRSQPSACRAVAGSLREPQACCGGLGPTPLPARGLPPRQGPDTPSSHLGKCRPRKWWHLHSVAPHSQGPQECSRAVRAPCPLRGAHLSGPAKPPPCSGVPGGR